MRCEIIEAEYEENPAVIFNLYEMVKKTRNWDDETLCKERRISEGGLEEMKVGHKPKVEGLGLRCVEL